MQTLAVLDVACKGTEKSKGEIVYGYIMDGIRRRSGYTIVERKDLAKVMKELELSVSDLVDENSAAKIGRLLGARYILLSSLNLEQGAFFLSMRIVDVETGKIVRTSMKRAETFGRIETLTAESVEYLLDLSALYGNGCIITRNFLSVSAGFGASFPMGDVSSVWGIGISPLIAGAYNLAFEWGIVGIGVVTGGPFLFSNQASTYQFNTLACPFAFTVRYETNLNAPFFGFAEAHGGISLLIQNYGGDSPVKQAPAGKPFFAFDIGAGYRITQNISISLLGTVNLILMDSIAYVDITPAVHAGLYF